MAESVTQARETSDADCCGSDCCAPDDAAAVGGARTTSTRRSGLGTRRRPAWRPRAATAAATGLLHPRGARRRSEPSSTTRTTRVGLPDDGGAREPGVRQPDRGGRAPRRRGGARPGLRRRHRHAAVGPARRLHRQGVRAGHDRGDARACSRRTQSRPGRPTSSSFAARSRTSPCPRRQRRRRHLQLRRQPVARQARGLEGDASRPRARRADRDLAMSWPRTTSPRPIAGSGARGSAASPARCRAANYLRLLAEAGFADGSVEFTHEVAPGLHGAIVRASKPQTAA